MHVISIPYSLMKVNPLSWIQKVCQYKGGSQACPQRRAARWHRWWLSSPASPSAKVACVKSRDMHWALVAHRDQRDINLSSLRMLIVADGANPCEWGRGAFLLVFTSVNELSSSWNPSSISHHSPRAVGPDGPDTALGLSPGSSPSSLWREQGKIFLFLLAARWYPNHQILWGLNEIIPVHSSLACNKCSKNVTHYFMVHSSFMDQKINCHL